MKAGTAFFLIQGIALMACIGLVGPNDAQAALAGCAVSFAATPLFAWLESMK